MPGPISLFGGDSCGPTFPPGGVGGIVWAGDLGQTVGAGVATGSASNVAGTADVGPGPSPESLDYFVDLFTGLPANIRIYRAVGTYELSGSIPTQSFSVTDDGGTGGAGHDWSQAGIAKLNANVGQSSVPIHAVGSWTDFGPPTDRSFGIGRFAIWYTYPVVQ
jgi:hypothetical protein